MEGNPLKRERERERGRERERERERLGGQSQEDFLMPRIRPRTHTAGCRGGCGCHSTDTPSTSLLNRIYLHQ